MVDRVRFACALFLAATGACSAPRAAEPALQVPAGAPDAARAKAAPPARFDAPALELPAQWETLPAARFERELERCAPLGSARRIAERDLARLAEALAEDAAPRAALFLARSGDPRGRAVLLALLERRLADADDAASLVAALALATQAESGAAPRLAALAHGRSAHPRLLVRVECAAAALAHGRDDVLEALLDVLRFGATVPAPPGDAEDLAEAQERAAHVLARRLGLATAFSPHASVAERAAEVARLAELVRTAR